ncbi:MAG TPA: hypothetical protein VHN78_06170, partial [Chloroflexota bacterium]|nr:hypothetical protein [Chloroflexota bacterium]
MELSQLATTTASVSPRLVVLSHVLALSSVALQELITAELAENPALELVETPRCPRCGAGQHQRGAAVCPHCLAAPHAEGRAAAQED